MPARDLRALAHRRLRNQRIAGPKLEGAADVVRYLGAMQSQEFGPARWSIGQRTRSLREADVDRALAAGEVLRTHLLRPTWHFVAREDIRWLLALTAPRVHQANAFRYRQLELDAKTLGRTDALLAQALEGGRRLVRAEVSELLEREGVETEGQRLAYILMHAELNAVTCSGPMRGGQQTYALLDERAPHAAPLPSRDEQLGELARRFFTSHGPATLLDYRTWSGLLAADARRGIEIAGDALERVEVAGKTMWHGEEPAGRAERSPSAHLLQGYDEYFAGHPDSRVVFDVAGLGGIAREVAGAFTHAVVIDGQLAGHWRRVASGKSVAIEVQWLREISARERDAAERAVARYGRFIGVETRLAT